MESKMADRKHTHKDSNDLRHLPPGFESPGQVKPKLEIVLKCDAVGSAEAISALIAQMRVPEAEINVINSGVGDISKQDLLMALSGSRLVIGFNVAVAPKLDQWIKEHGVEVRLYDVIYKLSDDLKAIARTLAPVAPEEKVTGKCEIIATFKSRKGGVILGCQVVEGSVQVGKQFRVVTAMGPVHSSRIESLQIEKQAVKEAKAGQQVGVQISGSSQGKVGDFIECFDVSSPKRAQWTPRGDIIHMGSS